MADRRERPLRRSRRSDSFASKSKRSTRSEVIVLCASSGAAADGVGDHARLLAEHLAERGYKVSSAVVNWRQDGLWLAFKKLRASTARRQGTTVLHYSHLSWSRRGLPFGFLLTYACCRLSGPVVVWVHDPDRVEGSDLRHRVGSWLKAMALRVVVSSGASAVLAVPPSDVYWAKKMRTRRLFFAPSPSNIGAAERRPPADMFTISLFGINATDRGGADVVAVVAAVVEELGEIRIRLLGAASESQRDVVNELRVIGAEVDAPGFVNSGEVLERLSSAHAFLSAKEALSTRSGTVAAALACGLPIVGFEGPETVSPLTEAGVLLARRQSATDELASLLVRLAKDPNAQNVLGSQSRSVSDAFFTWAHTVDVLERALAAVA